VTWRLHSRIRSAQTRSLLVTCLICPMTMLWIWMTRFMSPTRWRVLRTSSHANEFNANLRFRCKRLESWLAKVGRKSCSRLFLISKRSSVHVVQTSKPAGMVSRRIKRRPFSLIFEWWSIMDANQLMLLRLLPKVKDFRRNGVVGWSEAGCMIG
jgi:hypothetical protein